jgi:citrate lyase subunit beta/citryl-CoA lyase
MPGLDGARSYLFVPAADARRVDKALAGDAHAVIVDLEDAVAPDAKDGARRLVAVRLRTPRPGGGAQLVRINGLDTPHARADLQAIVGLALDGVVVPKAEPQPVQALPPSGPPLVALIETAAGLRRAYETASRPRVSRLMLGVVDLAAQLGATPGPDGRELLHARSALVVDSVAAGLDGPIDGPCTAIGDVDALRTETQAAKALGFAAKACIHPAQLETVHAVFAPTDEDLDWARRVVAAADGSRGAVAVDGQMVDAPVVARAQRLLDAAGR